MEENTSNQTQPSNKPGLMVAVVIVLLAAAGGYFVLNQNKVTPTNSEQVQTNAQAESPIPASQSGEVKEFTIDGSSYKFQPEKIEVKQGDTVKITFKDNDGMHDLVVDGYNVRTNILKGGTEDTIQFVADKTGTFKYYCSVANHEEQGMTGTLVVN